MKRLLIAGFLAAAANSPAQTTKYGPLALRLPASARMLAMGDVGVAGRDDDVVFYNPAQLFVARGTSASVERMSADVRGGTMSTVLRLGPGAVGFGVNYLEYRAAYGVYPISRENILDQAAGLPAASSTHAVIGYAQVIKRLRVGLSANYAVDEVGFDRFRNVVGDVGLARDFGRYTAALSLQHLGGSMGASGSALVTTDSVKPPMKATLGGSWAAPVGPLDVALTAGVSAMREGNVSPAAGGEVSWSWLSGYSIQGRGGFRYPRGVGDAKYTLGAGFVADRTAFDVAAEFMDNDKIGIRAGIRIR